MLSGFKGTFKFDEVGSVWHQFCLKFLYCQICQTMAGTLRNNSTVFELLTNNVTCLNSGTSPLVNVEFGCTTDLYRKKIKDLKYIYFMSPSAAGLTREIVVHYN